MRGGGSRQLVESQGRQFHRRMVKCRAPAPGSNPRSATSLGSLDSYHIVSEFQCSLCKKRLITEPASWVAVRIAFDNECAVLSPVAKLWYYVLWVQSKCSVKGSCLYPSGFAFITAEKNKILIQLVWT